MAATGRLDPVPARSRLRALASLAFAGFLLVSCAGTRVAEQPGEFSAWQTQQMFTAGYEDITDIYIDEIAIDDLAVSGLERLSAIDPNVTLRRGPGTLELRDRSQRLALFPTPAADDARGWAVLTSKVIETARAHSPRIRAADAEEIYERMFDGIVTRLDGYSRYAGRDEARENRASRDGFDGIGVRINVVPEGVRVLQVMEETPALAAGLMDNDLILSIDGEPTPGMPERDVLRKLRGPVDSQVLLGVERQGHGRLSIAVARSHIVPQTVMLSTEGNVAYLKISSFNQSTTRTLREKLRQARRELGNKLSGYVLDLRGNPGGLLDQAVFVSDLFLAEGPIVSTKGRHPNSHQYFEADTSLDVGNEPIIVLVNGNSASASEIVAAALQDSGRAILIGSNSFGKGSVQTVLRMPNEGELTLTWARFHAPSGYALHHRGVLPDICTSGEPVTASQALLELSSGRRVINRGTHHAAVAVDDEVGLAALRSRCPSRQTENASDLEIARRLLQDPTLLAAVRGRALEAAGPSGQVSQMLH